MKNRKGFTLIEIIAVVVILGILALIAIPSVSSYISNSRKEAYKAHEKTMEESAKSMTVEVINGKDDYVLPSKGRSKVVRLSELLEKEYLNELDDPATGNKCDASSSFVVIKNTGNSNYEYKACLTCGSYITDDSECEGIENVVDDPNTRCGTISGASTEWTIGPRTINVECQGNCLRSRFTKTFDSTTKKGAVPLKNKSGSAVTECEVNAYVDKTKPTCQLQINNGTEESTSWLSGRDVTISFVANSRKDAHSGISEEYGLGTSMKNPNYNKKESYELKNVSGTTTVMGYVKDKVGNEGICYKTVTTGIERPIFDIRYGYQIYPEKEVVTGTGVEINANNTIKTTTTTPKITFTGMSKYTNATRVVMELSSAVSDPTTFKLKVGSGSWISASSTDNKRLIFYIEKEPALSVANENTYEFLLGDQSGKIYTIKRIEVQRKVGDLKTKHLVSVNLVPRKQVVQTTDYSFNNVWQKQDYKLYDATAASKTGSVKIKNDVPLESDAKTYSISKGDATAPTITITGTAPTEGSDSKIVLTGKANDSDSKVIAYAWSTSSTISYYSTAWNYITPTTEVTKTLDVTSKGIYYFYAKDEAGNVAKQATSIYKINYTLNGATTDPSPKPTIAKVGNVYGVGTTTNIAKTFTVNINANGTNATLSATSASSVQTFEGWTYSGGTTSTAKHGTSATNVSTAWSNGSTKTTDKYFKDLKNTNEEVTLIANWKAVNVTLPTVTKTDYTCGYATSSTANAVYASGAAYTPDKTTNNVTLYVKCLKNAVITCANKTYNGNPQTIATCDGGAVQNAVQTNANTYTITCNNNADRGPAESKTCSINKDNATLTCSNTNYDGNSHTGCSCSGGEIGGDNVKTNAGTYTVSCTGDANHNSPSNATWTIIKADATLTCSDTDYNGRSQTGCSCYGGEIGGDNVKTDAGTYTVSCTGDANHNSPSDATWTINKVASSITCRSNQNYTGNQIKSYSDSSHCSTITNGYVTNAGTYTVTCNGDKNHTNSTCSFTVLNPPVLNQDCSDFEKGKCGRVSGCTEGNTGVRINKTFFYYNNYTASLAHGECFVVGNDCYKYEGPHAYDPSPGSTYTLRCPFAQGVSTETGHYGDYNYNFEEYGAAWHPYLSNNLCFYASYKKVANSGPKEGCAS